MTRRERLERRLERREAWATSRQARAAASFRRADSAIEGIPPGQPILVGHHSEGRHRRALDRHDNAMRSAFESQDMAAHHTSKAGGLAAALDSSIFSDDPDAVEALTARIAELEAKRARMVALNKAFRKGPAAFAAALGCDADTEARTRAKIMESYSWCRQPHPAYELSNLGGNITRLRKRLQEVERRASRTAEAEAAPGGVLIRTAGDYCNVIFAEKPARTILDDLRAAGFAWGGGCWGGQTARIPASVRALQEVAS